MMRTVVLRVGCVAIVRDRHRHYVGALEGRVLAEGFVEIAFLIA